MFRRHGQQGPTRGALLHRRAHGEGPRRLTFNGSGQGCRRRSRARALAGFRLGRDGGCTSRPFDVAGDPPAGSKISPMRGRTAEHGGTDFVPRGR